MREHLTDILYEAEIDGKQGYLYLLIEAQHKPDELMPFRILEYSVNIMRQHINTQKGSKETQRLPVVWPLVYYTGKGKYTASTDIFDNFAQPDLARQYLFNPLKLVALNEMSDDEICEHKSIAALEMVQKHIYDRDMRQAFETMLNNGVLLEVVESGGKNFQLLLQYAGNIGQFDKPEEFRTRLIEAFPDEENTVATFAQHYQEKGMQQGKQEIVLSLLRSGELSDAKISSITGVEAKELAELKKQLH